AKELEYIARQLARQFAKCSLTIEIKNDDMEKFSVRACGVDERLAGMKSAQGFVVPVMSDWIIFDASIFDILPIEEQLLSVIAHELGHYYQAHLAVWKDSHRYFYEVDKRDWAKRPE